MANSTRTAHILVVDDDDAKRYTIAHPLRSLAEIEEAVQNARRYYNAVVRDLNTKIDVFPSNIVANVFNFEHRQFFELAEAEREAPKVQF